MTVSGRQQRSLARHIHVSILPQTPFPSRLQHNIEQSSLHTMLGRSSCFKTSQRYLTMSNAVIFDTHTFLPTLQFLSFLMIFFFLFHTLVTVQKNLSRSDLFCFPIFFFSQWNLLTVITSKKIIYLVLISPTNPKLALPTLNCVMSQQVMTCW